MKKAITTLVAVALVGGAASVQAQVYSTYTTNNDGAEYWDHVSNDGTDCNIGFVLSGIAGNAQNPCVKQRPAGWLPYSGSAGVEYWNNGSGGYAPITFGSGTYTLTLLPGNDGYFGGDIATTNSNWGIIDLTTSNTIDLNSILNNSNNPTNDPVYTYVATDPWAFYIVLDGNTGPTATSDVDPQFAKFMTGNSLVIGMENADSHGAADYDYQDVLFEISGGPGVPENVTPEPATMSLLAMGLVGMAAASRRRRNKKS